MRGATLSEDKHLEALHGVWGETKASNGRVEQSNGRLDKMGDRIDATNERLERVESGVTGLGARVETLEGTVERVARRQVEAETRMAIDLAAVAGTVGEVRDLLRAQRDDRKRIDALEHRVGDLERKVR